MTDGDIHTMPCNDWVEHECSEDCVCGPTVEPVGRPDGSMGFHWTHHSLDNREAKEQANG